MNKTFTDRVEPQPPEDDNTDGRYQGYDKRAPLGMILCERCKRVMKPDGDYVDELRAVCLGCKKREQFHRSLAVRLGKGVSPE